MKTPCLLLVGIPQPRDGAIRLRLRQPRHEKTSVFNALASQAVCCGAPGSGPDWHCRALS
jgi:hypothetical protein